MNIADRQRKAWKILEAGLDVPGTQEGVSEAQIREALTTLPDPEELQRMENVAIEHRDCETVLKMERFRMENTQTFQPTAYYSRDADYLEVWWDPADCVSETLDCGIVLHRDIKDLDCIVGCAVPRVTKQGHDVSDIGEEGA